MNTPSPTIDIPRRAWIVLVLGVAAQAMTTVAIVAPSLLIPLLHTERGLGLAEAGLLASAPSLGMVAALIAWGAIADRFGEKWVITVGLVLTAAAGLGAILAPNLGVLGVWFLMLGMTAASSNAASGRVVMGWFPRERRGLAMGIRQMSQPLGTTIAALTIPVIADTSGIAAALVVPVALCVIAAIACALGLVNPPRRPAPAPDAATPGNPYRASSFLVRIHAVSVLLVLPQAMLSTFGLVWLVAGHGWTPLSAGIVLGIAQFVGAIGRILVGVGSDRLGSRVRLLRWVAAAAGLVMLLLGAADGAGWTAAVAIFVLATTVTVADNGLAFTSVAEGAGPRWAGRALGVQNTGQFIASGVAGPLLGGLIALVGYPIAFALLGIAPFLAIPLVPRSDVEHERAPDA